VVTVFWVRWNQITYAPLGRLLFQADAAIAALLGYGLSKLASRPRWVVAGVGVGLWALALAGALLIVRPAFALPQRYAASDPPVPPQALPGVTFGDDKVSAWGYGLSSRSLEPGEMLEVELFLQASRPLTEDYALALQLLSPVPGDDTALVNLNTIPGRGTYPTYAWQLDEVIVDRYRVEVPEHVMQGQAWQIVAILYRLSDGKRLPVSVAGQPAGEMLELALVRVGTSEPVVVPQEARLDPAPVFDEAIVLKGARAWPEDAEMRVALWWEAHTTPRADYTVFVHLVDGTDQLVGTGDGLPMEGAFPTSMWHRGDRLRDEHVVPLPPGFSAGVHTVKIGWYDPSSGARLPAVQGAERLPQEAVSVVLSPRR
jgi:hypothetical protein